MAAAGAIGLGVLTMPAGAGTAPSLGPVAFSPDGRRLATVNGDWTAQIWVVSDGG